MPFDPDKYLTKTSVQKTPSTGFDPDAYLNQKTEPEGFLKRTARGTLAALPYAGGVIGGVMASPTGPGAIPMAMMGAAGGAALEKLGEGFLNKGVEAKMPTLSGTTEAFKYPLEQAAMAGTGEAGGQVLGKAATTVAQTPVGQSVIRGVKGAASRVGETLTGVPKKVIETYAKSADKIKSMMSEAGGEIGVAADNARDKIYQQVLNTKKELGSQIGSALENFPKDRNIDIKPYLEKLEASKAKINPNYHQSDIDEIDQIISSIKKDNPRGKASLQSLNEMKNYLQDNAKSSYFKNGQIFSRGKNAANASKYTAGEVRATLNEMAPDVKKANSQLAKLHDIEENLNSSLITSGKSEGSLMAVGAGGGGRNKAALQDLGQLTGQDPVAMAEQLAAARTFGNPGLLPNDTTGKSLLRFGLGSGAGAAGAETLGLDPKKGAMVGGMLSSPMALRGLLDTSRYIAPAITNPLTQSILKQGAARGMLNRR